MSTAPEHPSHITTPKIDRLVPSLDAYRKQLEDNEGLFEVNRNIRKMAEVLHAY